MPHIKIKIALYTILFSIVFNSYTLAQTITLESKSTFKINGVNATLQIQDDDESSILTIKTKFKTQTFIIDQTHYGYSRELHLVDYNFDGYMDIGIAGPDMGMGVDTIFNFLIYQPKLKSYHLLKQENFENNQSKCNSLSNVDLIPKKKQMTTTCRSGASRWTDLYQLKNNQWIWIKSYDPFD